MAAAVRGTELRGDGARALLLFTPSAHARTPLYRKIQFHLKAAEPKLGCSFSLPSLPLPSQSRHKIFARDLFGA